MTLRRLEIAGQAYHTTQVLEAEEGGTQTFKENEILILTSGRATVASADPAAGTLLGIAAQDGHNSTAGTDKVKYIPFYDGLLLEMTLYDGTADSYALVIGDYGKKYGIAVSANKWYIDTNDTTNTRVVIVKFISDKATKDARVLARVLRSADIYD